MLICVSLKDDIPKKFFKINFTFFNKTKFKQPPIFELGHMIKVKEKERKDDTATNNHAFQQNKCTRT